jgi:hypothetical protein
MGMGLAMGVPMVPSMDPQQVCLCLCLCLAVAVSVSVSVSIHSHIHVHVHVSHGCSIYRVYRPTLKNIYDRLRLH